MISVPFVDEWEYRCPTCDKDYNNFDMAKNCCLPTRRKKQ